MSNIQLSDCGIQLVLKLSCVNREQAGHVWNNQFIRIDLDYTHFINNSDLNRLKVATRKGLENWLADHPNQFSLGENYELLCEKCKTAKG